MRNSQPTFEQTLRKCCSRKSKQANPPTHTLSWYETMGGGINEIITLEIMQIMSRHRQFQNFVSKNLHNSTEFYAKNYIEELLLAAKHIQSEIIKIN